jgi:hypothetical protein
MQTPDVKESPVRTCTLDGKDWKATRKFTGAFYADQNAFSDGLVAFGVTINSVHPINPFMYVVSIGIQQRSPVYWEATANYSLFQTVDMTKPLSAAPEISWEDADSTEPTDIDGFGNALLNSAGDPFPPQADQFGGDILCITRNEPMYLPQKNLTYRKKVNSDTWSPLGMFSLDPGQARCRSIRPTAKYVIGQPFVVVAYRFELRADGFATKILDEGSQGWYDDSGTPTSGPFYQAGNPVVRAINVRLDGTGKPVDPSFKVTATLKTPIANPTALPSDVKVTTAIPNGAFLAYTLPKSIAFAGIGL